MLKKNVIKDIDSGILDVVVALHACGVNTVASCEGHLDHGVAGPWIDIEADADNTVLKNKLNKLRASMDNFVRNSKFNKKETLICEKYHQILGKIRAPHLAEQAKIIALLADFYQNRNVPFDAHLHVAEIFGDGGCRLENQGVNIQEIRTKSQRAEKLKEYRAEMAAFGQFLKEKQ
jgi:hypothetical protein